MFDICGWSQREEITIDNTEIRLFLVSFRERFDRQGAILRSFVRHASRTDAKKKSENFVAKLMKFQILIKSKC